jgi:hypothetical protein
MPDHPWLDLEANDVVPGIEQIPRERAGPGADFDEWETGWREGLDDTCEDAFIAEEMLSEALASARTGATGPAHGVSPMQGGS